jgi:membrane fusion protein, multidrug efflux system
MKRAYRLFAIAGLVVTTGCSRETAKNEPAPVVRPVLSVVVKPANDLQIGFAGTVQPQYQTERGFRLIGRIIARYVFVGDVVEQGQPLARIDPLPYELLLRSSEADLAKAKSQLENSTGAEARSSNLRAKEVVSQSELDTKQQARSAAEASVQQAQANLDKAREQIRYTTLSADGDGVVTSTDADVGQIVSPGKKVMTLARLDIREAVVDLPENVTRFLVVGSPFDIGLQADTSIKTTGKVREIAPQADAATRTRRVKITLDSFTEPFRLGTTVTATPLIAANQRVLELPRSALLERDGTTWVWQVEPTTKTVHTVAVKLDGSDGAIVRVAEGLTAGTRVVTAGVHGLSEGQSVKIDERAAR